MLSRPRSDARASLSTSARSRNVCWRTSPTACCCSTTTASCVSGTAPPNGSRASRANRVLGMRARRDDPRLARRRASDPRGRRGRARPERHRDHRPARGRGPRAVARRFGRCIRGRHRLLVPRHQRGRAARPGEDRLRRHGLARAAHSAGVGLRSGAHLATPLRQPGGATAGAATQPHRRGGRPPLGHHRRHPAREPARLRPARSRERAVRRAAGGARASWKAPACARPEGIDFALSVPATLPQASGDGDKVRQVLSNLVENAVKYSPGGGRSWSGWSTTTTASASR